MNNITNNNNDNLNELIYNYLSKHTNEEFYENNLHEESKKEIIDIIFTKFKKIKNKIHYTDIQLIWMRLSSLLNNKDEEGKKIKEIFLNIEKTVFKNDNTEINLKSQEDTLKKLLIKLPYIYLLSILGLFFLNKLKKKESLNFWEKLVHHGKLKLDNFNNQILIKNTELKNLLNNLFSK